MLTPLDTLDGQLNIVGFGRQDDRFFARSAMDSQTELIALSECESFSEAPSTA
jgi:hypothetical protein